MALGLHYLNMQYQTEDQKIIAAMAQHGGSFVRQLAKCFMCADHINYQKLKKTFAVYWADYKRIANYKPKQRKNRNTKKTHTYFDRGE